MGDKSADDVVLYSDLTREIRSTKHFLARSLRTFSRALDAKLDSRFLEFETHLPNGELTALKEILPELQEIASRRRLADQGRRWLGTLVPRWVTQWVDRLITAIVVGFVLYALEHGWFVVPVVNHLTRNGHP